MRDPAGLTFVELVSRIEQMELRLTDMPAAVPAEFSSRFVSLTREYLRRMAGLSGVQGTATTLSADQCPQCSRAFLSVRTVAALLG